MKQDNEKQAIEDVKNGICPACGTKILFVNKRFAEETIERLLGKKERNNGAPDTKDGHKEDYKALYEALVEDVRKYGWRDVCDICAHNHQGEIVCELDCFECDKDCTCSRCVDASKWKWRGIPNE